MYVKIQDINNQINKKLLRLNYKSAKVRMSRGNLANFATLKRYNLAGNLLLQVFLVFLFIYIWAITYC